jgi:hypothetical protein
MYCLLCGHMDCDCQDVLTEEEYERLVKEGGNENGRKDARANRL